MTDPDAIAENDQMAARTRELLDKHVESARRTLKQGANEGVDEVYILAVIASTLIEAEEQVPRDALASMLALALIRLAKV